MKRTLPLLRPAPAWLTGAPIAHRGLFDGAGAPENSLSAFERAAERGYGIELDVHLSSDGEVMVFHDFTLKRMTGEQGPLGERTAQALSKLRLNNSDQTIPRLAEVIETVGGRVPLLIELKSRMDGRAGPLEKAVAAGIGDYDGPVCVQSFEPASMGWFVEYAPQFVRGQIATDFTRDAESRLPWGRRSALTHLRWNHVSQPDFVAYDVRYLPNPACRAVRRAGTPLVTWTVKTKGQTEHAKRYADNYVFEGFEP